MSLDPSSSPCGAYEVIISGTIYDGITIDNDGSISVDEYIIPDTALGADAILVEI